MSVGNVWLGSLVNHTIAASGDLTVSSFAITTTALSTPAVLVYASVNLSGSMSNTAYVTYSPAAGVNYSQTLKQQALGGLTSYFYQPSPPMYVFPGDTITLKVTNTTALGGVYGSITLLY